MKKRATRFYFTFALLVCAAMPFADLRGTTFVVPPDRELVRQATAIVIASPLDSFTQLRHERSVETVTTMSIEEVLKGSIESATIDIHEPGGTFGKRTTNIPGIPHFASGERYVLFLIKTEEGIWRVLNLTLGKFRFDTDVLGHAVVMRDARDIAGWDPDGKPHRETNRAAEPFVDFLRVAAKGGPAKQNYNIPAEPLLGSFSTNVAQRVRLRPAPLCTFPCAPTSYTYDYSSGTGARWNAFPVTYFTRSANAAANTALNNAIAAWNNDPNSAVTLVNGGADSGSHTGGAVTPDGQNTVAFEKDLVSEYGAVAFMCTGSSYNGTLGVAAITNDTGSTHIGPNGETFFTASEGDVEMNVGLSTCAFFIGLGDFNSSVAHELGHSIGFRHADDIRTLSSSTACSTDATLECSTSAIMKAYIPSMLNGALQTWDQHAVGRVYPNPTIAAPTGVEAHATAATTVRVTWTTVGGATSYHIYRSADNSTYTQVPGSPAGPPFNDTTAAANTAYLYRVRAFDGSTESADSNTDLATTVVPTNTLTPLVSVVKALDMNEVRSGVDAVERLAGITNTGYSDPTLSSSVTVKKTHIDQPLTRLNNARGVLSLGAVSLSGGAIVQNVTPIRASDINDLRAGFF
jgi:hypothetical protein